MKELCSDVIVDCYVWGNHFNSAETLKIYAQVTYVAVHIIQGTIQHRKTGIWQISVEREWSSNGYVSPTSWSFFLHILQRAESNWTHMYILTVGKLTTKSWHWYSNNYFFDTPPLWQILKILHNYLIAVHYVPNYNTYCGIHIRNFSFINEVGIIRTCSFYDLLTVFAHWIIAHPK
jgi:hypothetical protein